MKSAVLLAIAALLAVPAQASAVPEYAWYKNETRCGDARVIVHAYCEAANPYPDGSHSGCVVQRLTVAREGKASIVKDLNERRHRSHLPVWALTCMAGPGKPALYLRRANGGNCNECESESIIALDGRWKMDRRRWLVQGAEKRELVGRLKRLKDSDEVSLGNKIQDPGYIDE